MIAGQIGSGSSSLKTKFLREPHSFVAARARHFCEILCRHRGVGIEVRLDGMNAMTVGANRSLAVAAGDSLPVDALHEFLLHGLMTLRTGARDVELEDGRPGIAGGQDFMRAVTVGANRSFL